MKNSLKFAALLPSAFMLCACGVTQPADPAAVNALGAALRAEQPDKNIGALPDGKSIATNFNQASEFLIARKVGNVEGQPQCALFDIIVTRPQTSGFFLNDGDAAATTGLKVCLL